MAEYMENNETETENNYITTEQAFDMLPMVVSIYDKLEFKKYTEEVRAKNKNKKNVDATAVGLDIFMYIIRNCQKVKEEIFEIVSVIDHKTVEEVKNQNILITFQSFKRIFENEQLKDFFKQAM